MLIGQLREIHSAVWEALSAHVPRPAAGTTLLTTKATPALLSDSFAGSGGSDMVHLRMVTRRKELAIQDQCPDCYIETVLAGPRIRAVSAPCRSGRASSWGGGYAAFARSSAVRSQCPRLAAAAYVLSRKSISWLSGEAAWRTAS
jgi:hypothetical protein